MLKFIYILPQIKPYGKGMISVYRDEEYNGYRVQNEIEVLKEVEKQLFSQKERLRATLLSVGDAVIATDRLGNIEFLNPAAEKLTGWSQDEVMGRPFEEIVCIIDEYTREPGENIVKKVFETKDIVENYDYSILISRNGQERFVEDRAAPIREVDGSVDGAVLVLRDYTEKRERQARIEYLSYHDQLTGLYNRRFFEEELKRIDTERNLPITLVIGDINGLKLINDAFGHLVGDKALKRTADIIRDECRRDDIVARLGGDEYIILLPKTTYEDADKIVQRINNKISLEKTNPVKLSVSFGFETKRSADEDMTEVFKRAENFMYKQKLVESELMKKTTVKIIMETLYENIKSEKNHSESVGRLCAAMGEAMGFRKEEVDELRTLGRLHDIGKISINSHILNLSRELTDSERFEIKRHLESGYRILSLVKEFAQISDAVLAHHERWDGSGYPKGLKGEEISYKGRILAIADAYDAMTGERPYKKPLSTDEAAAEIKRNAGAQFDPEFAKIFVEKVLKRNWESIN